MNRARTRRSPDPIRWFDQPREDGRPILGDTPAERQDRLARLRAAIRAAGWSEAEANGHARRVFHQPGVELLTAREADAMIAAIALAERAAA